MLVDEHVYQMYAHVWRLLIQFEEPAIISLSQCFPDLESMNYAWVFLLFGSEFLHHSERLHLHTAKNLVKNLVREEFLQKKLSIINLVFTYDKVALNLLLVHVMQLRLALVELVEVRHLKRNPRMRLVYLDGEWVLDSLDRQVLPHRSELLINIAIVRLPLLPLFVHQFQRLLQHLFRPDLGRIGSRGQPEVGFLEHLARSFHCRLLHAESRQRLLFDVILLASRVVGPDRLYHMSFGWTEVVFVSERVDLL